jgi:nucleotide-binding universal stress UspA family protein
MDNADRSPVVVGANGTAAGLAAVRTAAVEAVARGRALRVVHAFTYAPYDAGQPYDVLRQAAADILERALLTARRVAPRHAVTGHLVDGPPARVLLQQSRTAGLLVLGDDLVATGAVPADSVLMQVVARSWAPVLVTHGGGSLGGPVLAAVDGSPAADAALRYAAAEARRRGAALDVVHAAELHTDADEARARQVVDAARAALPAGVRGRARLVPGDPVTAVAAAARTARLLVIGPRGAAGGHGGSLGRVGQGLVRRAACPVIVLHGSLPRQAPRRPDVTRDRVPH